MTKTTEKLPKRLFIKKSLLVIQIGKKSLMMQKTSFLVSLIYFTWNRIIDKEQKRQNKFGACPWTPLDSEDQ